MLGMPVTFAPLYKSIKALKKAATTIDNQRKVSLNQKKIELKSLMFLINGLLAFLGTRKEFFVIELEEGSLESQGA